MSRRRKQRENPNENFSNTQGQPDLVKPESTIGQKIAASLEENIAMIRDMFFNDDTVKIREFSSQNNRRLRCALAMVDGMVDHVTIDLHIMTPINLFGELQPGEDLFDAVQSRVVSADEIAVAEDADVVAEGIVSGDTVLFIEGYAKALVINTKGWETRSIQEPASEIVTRGPREGFVEAILVNLSLIRRKIQSPELKFKFKKLGARTQTRACLVYHEALVNHQILAELVRRMNRFDLDGVLSAEYLTECITDAPYSPFMTIGTTERPDIVAAKILEGRIAVFIDGTPSPITLPYLFIESFQANEDYYANFYFSSFMRIIRIIGFFLTISIPAVYIALEAFHQEFLPTTMLLSIITAREDVPFPAIVELIGMLAAFEILREAGARMPSNVGQALSIVGALVLGQAAVSAKIVSAPIIIIAALTGISAILVPRLGGAVIITRVAFLIMAAILGMYGYLLALAGLMLHLFNLRSFGVPYMLNMTSFDPQDMKDTWVRAPWWYMRTRPRFITGNIRRKTNR